MKAARSGWWMLAGLLVVGATGCNQSFEQGMAAICQSPISAAAQVAAAPDAPAKATAASLWLGEHLKNAEARQLFQDLAPLTPEQKAQRVREAATRAGLGECPLAEIWAPRS
jgi:hypothetical protein